MILNDEQQLDIEAELLTRRVADGTQETWEEEQIRNCLNTIADLKRQLAEREAKLPYPRPCGLCLGQIESKEDLDWHGLGNCVPICDICLGSGIENRAALDAYVQEKVDRAVLAEHKNHAQFVSELYAILCDPCSDGDEVNEAQCFAAVMESAKWSRQHIHDLEMQLNEMVAANRAKVVAGEGKS